MADETPERDAQRLIVEAKVKQIEYEAQRAAYKASILPKLRVVENKKEES